MFSEKEIEKIGNAIKIVIFICLVIAVIIINGIPQLKQALGSSDLYYNINNYSSIVGIEIEDEADFALVLNEEKVIGILFFNNDALIMYNQNIEKKEIEQALDIITRQLNEYSINRSIKIINYGQDDTIYDKIKIYMNKKYPTKVTFNTGDLVNKAKSLGLNEDEEIIDSLYNYSNSLIKEYKNDIIIEKIVTISYNEAEKYAINIYKKLLTYSEYINNQKIDDDQYPIQLIEVDMDVIDEEKKDKKIVPNSNSWYYIKDGIVYAYIEFTNKSNNYGFCFSGNIDSMKEGNCNEKFD